MDRGHLLLDADAIGREAAGYVEELTSDDVSDGADDGEGENAGDGDGEDPGDTADFEAADGWGEQECEREGEGEWDEELAGEVKDENRDGEHEEGLYPWELVASRAGHTTSEVEGWSVASGQGYIKGVRRG